jgi:hypothetical protein
MKLTYKSICDNPQRLRSLVGFDRAGFEALHQPFSDVAMEYLRHWTWEGIERQRSYSLTRDGIFSSTEDMLLFILSYLKNNPVQEYHATLFGIRQPKANVRIRLLSQWLRKTLERLAELPARDARQLNQQICTSVELLLDGTERPIGRSVDQQGQQEHFSGKKNGTR